MEFPDQIKIEPKPKQRKGLIIIIIVLGVVGSLLGIPFAIEEYEEYQNRYLSEAEARLNIADTEGAILALQQHSLLNPEDITTQIKIASLLMETGDLERATQIWERIVVSSKTEEVLDLYDAFVRHQVSQTRLKADLLFEQKGYEAYIYEGNKLLKLLPTYSKYRFANKEQWEQNSYNLDVMTHLETSTRLIYSHDKLGHQEEVNDSYNPFLFDFNFSGVYGDDGKSWYDPYSSPLAYVQSQYIDLLEGDANIEFDGKKWLLAAEIYKKAADYSEKLWKSTDRKEDAVRHARLFGNYAISLSRSERYTKAATELESLLITCPDVCFSPDLDWGVDSYKENIASWKSKAGTERRWNEYEKLNNEAGKKFKKEDWTVAVAAYKKLAIWSEKNNMPNNTIGQAKYNVAMALINAKRNREAIDLLKQIRDQYPEYESELVQEQITDQVRWCSAYVGKCS